MSRRGIRPHIWKVQGEVPHQQYCCWQKARAQAHFRSELWMLTFEDFQQVWLGLWDRRGRGRDDVCMVREDPEGAWVLGNVTVIARIDHLRRQRQRQKMEAL